MIEESNQDGEHPQTTSFHFLFPKPDLQTPSNCGLEAHFKDVWNEKFNEISITFVGLSAKTPNFDHRQAEIGGNDYACTIFAHFNQANEADDDNCITLGSIPYPERNGEFVLQGNRYIFPLYLRTSTQYKKLKKKLLGNDLDSSEDAATDQDDLDQQEDERKTDNLHVVLLHELIEHRFKNRLNLLIENLHKNEWNGNIRLLSMSLSGWLKTGNNTLIHRHIDRYGQLIDRNSPLNRIFQRKELSFYGLGGEHPDSTRGFIVRDVDDGAACAGFRVIGAVYDLFYSREHCRARAHRAGFYCNIERAIYQSFVL